MSKSVIKAHIYRRSWSTEYTSNEAAHLDSSVTFISLHQLVVEVFYFVTGNV